MEIIATYILGCQLTCLPLLMPYLALVASVFRVTLAIKIGMQGFTILFLSWGVVQFQGEDKLWGCLQAKGIAN